MSDTNMRQYRTDIRWQLLTTVSAIALIASACGMGETRAADSDRPLLWIELNGQLAQQETGQNAYLPPFALVSSFDGVSRAGIEKASPTIWDKGAKVTFQPIESDWVLSLALRYGKTARTESTSQLTTHPYTSHYGNHFYSANQIFKAQSSESHVIMDFRVGKDVGLGMFGGGGSSIFSAGVRIAQFDARDDIAMKSQPTNVKRGSPHNIFYGSFAANRRFNGIGPSLSWDASANVVGVPNDGGISLDWGVNGAVLFGRQKVSGQQRTAENNVHTQSSARLIRYSVYQHSPSPDRSRQATVPNLGGFAGVSWRYPNAKVSAGYRADFFFGAMDGGIDARKNENVGFHGPFASVSVGIGG
jgi:hypothetical protein